MYLTFYPVANPVIRRLVWLNIDHLSQQNCACETLIRSESPLLKSLNLLFGKLAFQSAQNRNCIYICCKLQNMSGLPHSLTASPISGQMIKEKWPIQYDFITKSELMINHNGPNSQTNH